MKHIISVLLCFVTALVFPVVSDAAETPAVSAEAFVLYCVENGEIILSKNENKRMKPASTTKLMTALLTLEQAAKNDRVITFTSEMQAEGSSMYLGAGEQVRLSDLAAGMMMASGNDAANAAAISIAGSLDKFAALMNRRAAETGMKNTHFVTPSGLDDENHYSTAYDLALLMESCLKNPDFALLTSQKSAGVSFITPREKKITFSNHNRLLRMYPDCIGGKTGYTSAAGRCLVSAARRDGLTLICVTLNDRDDWNDHIALYDCGFSQRSCYRGAEEAFCAELPCVGGESDSVPVMGESGAVTVCDGDRAKDVEKKIYLDSFVYAPVNEGDVLGRIDCILDGKVVRSIPLTAVEGVKAQKIKKNLLQRIKEKFKNG